MNQLEGEIQELEERKLKVLVQADRCYSESEELRSEANALEAESAELDEEAEVIQEQIDELQERLELEGNDDAECVNPDWLKQEESLFDFQEEEK
ncbi:hypothetical protein [Enterococcus sp.]|uniref:hypothetical protein n=1 Tax=Enterococcus sp. TaxID=35783 RepID=UPI002FC9D247